MRFWVSEGWFNQYAAHVGIDRSQLNCCAPLHFRLWERPLILLREHLLPDKNSGNTRPVAIAVPDDMCLGKLGPILWLSFLHLCHVYQDERYGFGTLVMPCLGMVVYISAYFLFIQYWRWAGMSCEIDVLCLRLSIYTESLDDLNRYTSLHASESHLSYQRRVVGLVWGHPKLTSHQLWLWMFCPFQTWLNLNYHLMSLHFNIKTCRHCWADALYVLGSSYVLCESFWVGIVSWWWE